MSLVQQPGNEPLFVCSSIYPLGLRLENLFFSGLADDRFAHINGVSRRGGGTCLCLKASFGLYLGPGQH